MFKNPKTRKIGLWLLLAMLLAALVYAGPELLGQSNKKTADAGKAGGELEMAGLDTIKPSKTATKKINVSQDKRLDQKIKRVDAEYKRLADKAGAESLSAGHVSEATRNAGLACASNYKAACEERADLWAKKGNEHQATLLREAGETRVKNAEMTFYDTDRSRIKAYNAQMEKMSKARKSYLENCKDDLSDQDKAAIKAGTAKSLASLDKYLGDLISGVTDLINQIQGLMSGGVTGVVSGCAKAAVTGQSDPLTDLFSNVTSLLDMVQNMSGNSKALMSEVAAL